MGVVGKGRPPSLRAGNTILFNFRDRHNRFRYRAVRIDASTVPRGTFDGLKNRGKQGHEGFANSALTRQVTHRYGEKH